MPTINEAYRILNDPGRRANYDRSLRDGPSTSSAVGSHADGDDSSSWSSGSAWDASRLDAYGDHRPARVPWRMLLFSGTIAIIGVVVLAQFTGSGQQIGPDGILRNGDCVEVEPNNDAREVACTGDADLVVRAFVPFDGTCPGATEPHRDRQGMGVACIERPVAG